MSKVLKIKNNKFKQTPMVNSEYDYCKRKQYLTKLKIINMLLTIEILVIIHGKENI